MRQPEPETHAANLQPLRSLALFDSFSERELEQIAKCCTLARYGEGETLVREGDPPDGRVYFLLAGQVSVFVNEKFILSLNRRGDIIGEMSLIGEEPRSATVRADDPSEFLVLRSVIDMVEDSDPDYRLRYYFTRMFSAILSEKLRLTSDRAKLYEEAVLHSREVEAHSSDLEERIAHNLRQIRLYSHLVDTAKDAILIANLEGIVESANPSFAETFAIPVADAPGMSLHELLGLARDGAPDWAAVAAAATDDGWSGEVAVRAAGGSEIPADCTVSLVHDGERVPLAYSVLLRDIRERKAYQQRIRKQQEELEGAYRELQSLETMKDHFLTRISHELRTPLAGLLGSLELLTTPGMVDPEERDSFVEIIYREAGRLGELVDRLLAISKLESGQMLLRFESICIGDLIHLEMGAFHERAKQKGIVLEFERPAGEWPVTCDPEQIRVAVRQILDNAVSYTAEGRIALSVSQTETDTLLRVSDTGPGIAPDRQGSLFDTVAPFGRDPGPEEGFGLGLPLSNLIVKAHSGKIWVESEAGLGSTFFVSLPRTPTMARETFTASRNPTDGIR